MVMSITIPQNANFSPMLMLGINSPQWISDTMFKNVVLNMGIAKHGYIICLNILSAMKHRKPYYSSGIAGLCRI
jgi:hypothetical protein